ncbi:MAG: hypothetical protein ABIK27_04765 [Bacteroidota bacterium]
MFVKATGVSRSLARVAVIITSCPGKIVGDKAKSTSTTSSPLT